MHQTTTKTRHAELLRFAVVSRRWCAVVADELANCGVVFVSVLLLTAFCLLHFLLLTRHCSFRMRYWLLAYCLLPTAYCSLLTACFLPLTSDCLLLIAHFWLLTAYCSLRVTQYLLLTACASDAVSGSPPPFLSYVLLSLVIQ